MYPLLAPFSPAPKAGFLLVRPRFLGNDFTSTKFSLWDYRIGEDHADIAGISATGRCVLGTRGPSQAVVRQDGAAGIGCGVQEKSRRFRAAPCCLKRSKAIEGATPMPTVQQLRTQAKQCLELANRTNELYAKNALKELAQNLNRQARQAEHRDRDRRRVVDSGLGDSLGA